MSEVTPRDIAERFSVPPLTVRNHLRKMFRPVPDGSRWFLDEGQEAAIVARLVSLGYVDGEAEGPGITSPVARPWTPPAVSDVVYELPKGDEGARVVTRDEFALQGAFADWLTLGGTPPALLPLSSSDGVVHPDLFVPDRGWIVEAKRSTDREYVRMAIGQVLDYCHLATSAGLSATPVILLPSRPSDDLVALLRSLGITLVYRDGRTFAVTPASEDIDKSKGLR
ncbi:hypothetical protein [Arsenicicoccus sp. UBA7492]|uniref:hypothetical protein n=1 Tax=Arsenicicoccus sp. UBA7492 TaxID=1946057 RepID=UPI00257B981D|nr:hypothetical protein [Arsenicicoccus sp. UBA7492]